MKDKYTNGLNNVVNNVILDNMPKAPLTNLLSADYNLRNELYTFNFNNLTYRYATDGIFKRLIQEPINNAFNQDFKIVSDNLDENQKAEIKHLFFEKDLFNKVTELFYWNRLYGGSAMIIDKSNKYDFDYIVVNRWDLSEVSKVGSGIYESNIEKDIYFLGEKIEKKNIILLTGEPAPYYLKKLLNGWGLSVAEPLVTPSNLYQKMLNLIYELIDECKIDVFSIKGFKDSLIAGEDKYIIDQIELTNKLKNFHNAIVQDADDKFEQKQLSNIASLTGIIQEIKNDICAAVKIPETILWGKSINGFSSGSPELIAYQQRINNEIQPQIKPVLIKILRYEIFNEYEIWDNSLDIQFNNFIIKTLQEIELEKQNNFNRLLMLYQNKLLTKKEFFDALKENNIYNSYAKASELNDYSEQAQPLTEDKFVEVSND